MRSLHFSAISSNAPLGLKFCLVQPCWKPIRRFPIFRNRRGIDDAPMTRRPQASFCEKVRIIYGAKQMNRNIDVLGPIVAVDVFLVIIREKERLSTQLQNAVRLCRDGFQFGVVINGLNTKQRIEKFAVTWKCGSVGNKEERIRRISILPVRLCNHPIRQIDTDDDSSGCALGQHPRGPTDTTT